MKPETDPLDALLAADVDEEPRPGFDTSFRARLEEQKARSAQRGFRLWLFGLGVGVATTAAIAIAFIAPNKTDEAQTALEIAYEMELYEDYDVVADLEVLELLAAADSPKTDEVPQ
ncbi:MAG: hypothetical protein ACAI38_08090 [Myxococcota bacterium]|nr:hypothetical protein [Myxococcota bacterium]